MAGERTLPGLGLTGYWTPGTGGWDTGMDVNMRALSAIVQLSVISATTSLPAGSDGDIYIVPTGDTNGDDVAIKDNGSWVYLTPNEGWRAWVQDDTEFVYWDGAAWTAEPSGGGATTFVGLSDTPANFTSAGYKKLRVNSGATAVEFVSPGIVINPQTGTSYTAVLADGYDTMVTMDNASANDFYLPTNASVAYPVGTQIAVKWKGVGQPTVHAPSGGTLDGVTDGAADITAQWNTVMLTKLGTDAWTIDGPHDGVA